MPFIAIAAIIALCLGGGVSVAADQAKPGDALYSYKVNVNDQVRHEYHAIKTSLHIGADANTQEDASGDTHLAGEDVGDSDSGAAGGATTTVHGALRVREDASDDAKAADDRAEGSGGINADGSIKVNTY